MVNPTYGINSVKGLKYTSFQRNSLKTENNPKVNITKNSVHLEFFSETKELSFQNTDSQTALFNFNNLDDGIKSGLTYKDKPISKLSPEEALKLIGEEGYFGVNKTSKRMSDFVLKGAGDNLERLKSGREGVLRGFKEAEKLWGGELPEISYETMEKTLGMIDERIAELGGNIVDVET